MMHRQRPLSGQIIVYISGKNLYLNKNIYKQVFSHHTCNLHSLQYLTLFFQKKFKFSNQFFSPIHTPEKQNIATLISTPSAKGNQFQSPRKRHRTCFNPCFPCRVLHYEQAVTLISNIFQSTLLSYLFQSTHPLQGVTRFINNFKRRFLISIHTPFAGCDRPTLFLFVAVGLFQSTHPLQGVTSSCSVEFPFRSISIHTPFAGCDGN